MLQQVTITQVDRRQIDTVKGPATKVGIKTDVHGEQWLGTFVNKFNDAQLSKLASGQKVWIQVEENGQYLNFRLPGATDFLKERVAAVEKALGLENPFGPSFTQRPAALQRPIQAAPQVASWVNDSQDSINPEDIPF